MATTRSDNKSTCMLLAVLFVLLNTVLCNTEFNNGRIANYHRRNLADAAKLPAAISHKPHSLHLPSISLAEDQEEGQSAKVEGSALQNPPADGPWIPHPPVHGMPIHAPRPALPSLPVPLSPSALSSLPQLPALPINLAAAPKMQQVEMQATTTSAPTTTTNSCATVLQMQSSVASLRNNVNVLRNQIQTIRNQINTWRNEAYARKATLTPKSTVTSTQYQTIAPS